MIVTTTTTTTTTKRITVLTLEITMVSDDATMVRGQQSKQWCLKSAVNSANLSNEERGGTVLLIIHL